MFETSQSPTKEAAHFAKLKTEYANTDVVGGKKHDTEKPPLSLIPSSLLWEMAKVLAQGADKYGTHNWRKGIHLSRLISAAMRHITAFNEGEDLDPESGLPHLAHAACEIAFALEQSMNKIVYDGFDDRYRNNIPGYLSKQLSE